MVVQLAIVCHSELVAVVIHEKDVVGATTRENVYLVQHITRILGTVNLGFITTALVLDGIRHALVI